jgi:CheY-like chemotaxis protein
VVTDHAMPGMTGTELARQIRQIWPSLPIILATGYAELPNGEDPGLPRLSKPYVQEELASQIAMVTAETGANVISLDSARRA